MERRVLSWAEGVMGDGMEGVGRYGRYGWNGRNGRSWKVWMEFRAKIQLFSDTAKFGGVIRKCLNYAFRLKVVKLPYS